MLLEAFSFDEDPKMEGFLFPTPHPPWQISAAFRRRCLAKNVQAGSSWQTSTGRVFTTGLVYLAIRALL
jgi:hypothetical protein